MARADSGLPLASAHLGVLHAQYFRFSFWKSLVLSRGRGRSPKTWESSASRSTNARMLAAIRSRSGEEGCGARKWSVRRRHLPQARPAG